MRASSTLPPIVLLLTSFVAAQGPADSSVVLSLGPVGSAVKDGNQIILAVALKNEGGQPAAGVLVDAIRVNSAKLIEPSSLPLKMGVVTADGRVVIRATLVSDSKLRDRSYQLMIQGQYELPDGTHRFNLKQAFELPASAAAQTAKLAFVYAQSVTGAPFKPSPVQPQTFQLGEDEDRPPLPAGNGRGLRPEIPATAIQKMGAIAGQFRAADRFMPRTPNDPVLFRRQTIIGNPGTFIRPPEPTGATSFRNQSPSLTSDVVFAAGNTNAAYSVDGGATFVPLDPSTIFPFTDSAGNPIDGGLCCDQVVQYVPSINRYVWLIMTRARANPGHTDIGPNRLRIAVASPQDIVASAGTRWTYFDLTTSTFGFGSSLWLDFPELAFGNGFLYVSADVVEPLAALSAPGLLVARISLAVVASMPAAAPMPLEFMPPEFSSMANGSRLVQHTGDTAFWAGHLTDSTLRVFAWPEASSTATPHDVTVYTWAGSDYTSIDPDGKPWLPPFGCCSKIMAGTRRSGTGMPGDHAREVWFAWTAGRGHFPHPYIEIVRIDAADFSFISQLPVWNPDHVFAYPSLSNNADNEVGMAAAWGGTSSYGNTAVGILGDFIMWITGVSDMSAAVFITRGGTSNPEAVFGDYLTVRTHEPDEFLFSGYTYQVKRDITNPGICSGAVSGCRFEVLFTIFGRRSRLGP